MSDFNKIRDELIAGKKVDTSKVTNMDGMFQESKKWLK